MDTRYSVGKEEFKKMNTEQLRDEFLITDIFRPDDVSCVYSHVDRIVVMGVMPVKCRLNLEKNLDVKKEFGVNYLLERRELGSINIGGSGKIIADGTEYVMNLFDCLYLPMGTKNVEFVSDNPEEPSKFYTCTVPASCTKVAKHVSFDQTIHKHEGDISTSDEKTINFYLHPETVDTCQLSMGLTHLEEGSVWGTIPFHIHERRMEIYFYFDIPKDNTVFHFMGESDQTRHIAVHNEEAVINPSWSVHSGCGTSNYTFIFAMCGENRNFADKVLIKTEDLR